MGKEWILIITLFSTEGYGGENTPDTAQLGPFDTEQQCITVMNRFITNQRDKNGDLLYLVRNNSCEKRERR